MDAEQAMNKALGGAKGYIRPHTDRPGLTMYEMVFTAGPIPPEPTQAALEWLAEDIALLLYQHAHPALDPFTMIASCPKLRKYVNELVLEAKEFPE